MQLSDIISLKFPNVDLIHEVQICDDGTGSYIKTWNNSLGPFPTSENLAQWEQDVQEEYNKIQINLLNGPILHKLNDIDLKTIRALREGNQDRLNSLEAEATSLRQELIK